MAANEASQPQDEWLPIRPEALRQFRLARLLVLLDVVANQKAAKPLDIERLGFYDFFAANPFLILAEEEPERRDLRFAGFNANSLSYNSSAQRFTNRRARMQHDLTILLSLGLAHAETTQSRITYRITEKGAEFVSSLRALYAIAYRQSALIVLRRLNPLSDTRLREEAKRWLRAESFLIDIYDTGEEG